MIELNNILDYYPPFIAQNAAMHKHILKEYVELLALEYISHSPYVAKLSFIGGTNLRLIQGIDRFSEDLDFDCKSLNESEFVSLTDDVIDYLRSYGLQAEARDKSNQNLTAFRRNIYFSELLFELGLSGHREERFLMKIEAQDQGFNYANEIGLVNRVGFLFSVPVPNNSVLLSMKLSALLIRSKGRDFYDTLFLWQRVDPDYDFLKKRVDIHSPYELKKRLIETLRTVDLQLKKRDFEHLLFSSAHSEQILYFEKFLQEKIQ